jgi:hypothetical protein
MPRRPAPLWYVLVAVLVSSLLVSSAGIWYTNYVDGQRERAERESDRRWCALLTDLDGAYESSTPQTELGRRIAAAIHELRGGFGCR